MLIILDGWGHSPDPAVSAITRGHTPFMDNLYSQAPYSELITHGELVGLPEGQMGNSEVGHMNIGAGRIIYQELTRINKAILNGDLDRNPVLLEAISRAIDSGRPFHLVGLVSDGGVHAHEDHLIVLCKILHEHGVNDIVLHTITDGRDVDPKSGIASIRKVMDKTSQYNARIASIIGRYYAMDRDKRWQRTKLAYDLLVHGKGSRFKDPEAAIKTSYENDVTDEFIKPVVITDEHGDALPRIIQGDVVLFFNFRTDRPRQLTEALTQSAFPEQNLSPLDLEFFTMTEYGKTFKDIPVLFDEKYIPNTLGDVLSSAGCTQLRIAETEKYPHVTYFFSGGREDALKDEHRIMIPSPKVATYDLQPEMNAPEVTNAVIKYLSEQPPDFICLNYANTDMVGHTGDFNAAIMAVETVDQCLTKLIPVALDFEYEILIIADHGNADTMIQPDGRPHTAHTKNPVPCIYLSGSGRKATVRDGKLADIAPTLLYLMGLDVPEDMTGDVLVVVEGN